MSTADWFTRKLAGGAQSAPTPSSPPPTQPHQAPATAPPPQPPPPVDPEKVQPGDPGSFTHALRHGNTRGGPATKAGALGTCPGCGSGNYVKLKNGESCFDCGYPLIQFGSDLGEGGSQ